MLQVGKILPADVAVQWILFVLQCLQTLELWLWLLETEPG